MTRHLYHKYHAKRTECDGIKFHSKKESKYYLNLKERVKDGEVILFLRQVPIHMPGNTVYRLDFLEFHADGTCHFVDVKGFKTETYKLKKRIIENLYPITIEEK